MNPLIQLKTTPPLLITLALKNINKQLTIIALATAAMLSSGINTAKADISETPAQAAESHGVKAVASKDWKSANLHAELFRLTDPLDGIICVEVFQNGRSILEYVYIPDEQLDKFPASQAYLAHLAIISGSFDWEETNSNFYRLPGKGQLAHKGENFILIMKDSISHAMMKKLTGDIPSWIAQVVNQ